MTVSLQISGQPGSHLGQMTLLRIKVRPISEQSGIASCRRLPRFPFQTLSRAFLVKNIDCCTIIECFDDANSTTVLHFAFYLYRGLKSLSAGPSCLRVTKESSRYHSRSIDIHYGRSCNFLGGAIDDTTRESRNCHTPGALELLWSVRKSQASHGRNVVNAMTKAYK